MFSFYSRTLFGLKGFRFYYALAHVNQTIEVEKQSARKGVGFRILQ